MKVQNAKPRRSALDRLLITASIAAMSLAISTSAWAVGTAYSGSWFNPEQSGHGISFEYGELDDGSPYVIAFWYVYDNLGNPIFLVGQGEPAGNTVALDMYAPYGMRFGDFDPDMVERPGTFDVAEGEFLQRFGDVIFQSVKLQPRRVG